MRKPTAAPTCTEAQYKQHLATVAAEEKVRAARRAESDRFRNRVEAVIGTVIALFLCFCVMQEFKRPAGPGIVMWVAAAGAVWFSLSRWWRSL